MTRLGGSARPVLATAVAAGMLAVLLAAPASADARVVLSHVQFQPSQVTITAGQTVTWVHQDGNTPHSVTSDPGSPERFDSNPNCSSLITATCMTQNSPPFTHTFSTPGTYAYHCKVHANMTGTVVVDPAPNTTTTTTAPPATAPLATVTTRPTTTATRALTASNTTTTTQAGSTTTGLALTPGAPPPLGPDPLAATQATRARSGGGGGGGGGVMPLVVALLVVAGGGGYLLWRLRPRHAPPAGGE